MRVAAATDYRLLVEGGIHDGAELALAHDKMIVIGSAPDSDVCLADTDVAAHHAAFGGVGGAFGLRAMDGGCLVNGRRLNPGQTRALAGNARVELAPAGVVLRLTDKPPLADRDVNDEADKRGRRWWLLAAVLPLVFGVAMAGQALRTQGVAANDPPVPLAALLERLELADRVELSTDADGSATLRGILTGEDHALLARALAATPHDVNNRTQTATRLLEQVGSVFRTNGLNAELEYRGAGAVVVTNLDGSNARIRAVAGRAREDVPLLAALEFELTKPAGDDDDRLAFHLSDPDKRLTTIVDGETAYVATTDGARYFVGSILPGGIELRAITEDGIEVDDDGEIHWITL